MLGQIVIQEHLEQRLMHPDAALVFNKTKLAKAIHEEAYAGPRRTDHIGQGLLRDCWNNHLRFTRFPKLRHQ